MTLIWPQSAGCFGFKCALESSTYCVFFFYSSISLSLVMYLNLFDFFLGVTISKF